MDFNVTRFESNDYGVVDDDASYLQRTSSTLTSQSSFTEYSLESARPFRKTRLLLPVDSSSIQSDFNSLQRQSSLNVSIVTCSDSSKTGDDGGNEHNTEISDTMESASIIHPERNVFLSYGGFARVEESFMCNTTMMQRCNKLLSEVPKEFNEHSNEKIIYASQRELAHTDSDCILLSDRATTCHILILRSISPNQQRSLCTVAHIDGCSYEQCIRKAFNHHRDYHHKGKEKSIVPNPKIEIDIHILGGFVEEKANSSRKISNWLLHLLADLADEMIPVVTMTLQTVAITSMNTTTIQTNGMNDKEEYVNCPIGRGLAINTTTGKVFLAKCTRAVMGPAVLLRHARLWSLNGNEGSKLLEICDESCNGDQIIIQPFRFGPSPYLEDLLKHPDEIMIHLCSTSPHCEEDDFCSTVRETICFLSNVSYHQVFGGHSGIKRKLRRRNRSISNDGSRENLHPKAAVFQRCPFQKNSWQLVSH